MRGLRLIPVLALLAACGSIAGADRGIAESAATEDAAQVADARALRLDVFPADLLNGNGRIRVLPQTDGPFDVPAGEIVPARDIDLRSPGPLIGVVVASTVTPLAAGADLPSIEGPISASVDIIRPQSIQNYHTDADETGFFETTVVTPEENYLVAIVPDDPTIPFETREVTVLGSGGDLEFTLDYGVPIYGRVTTGADQGLADARVHAIDAHGTEGAVAFTDADGWYLLRVLPGDYVVVVEGRELFRDPTLMSDALTALPPVESTSGTTGYTGYTGYTAETPVEGARVDFNYPNLSGPDPVGRVTDADDIPISGVTVRFTAKALEGYDSLNASLVITDVTDQNGNFDAQLIDGTYRVEFLPVQAAEPDDDHAPALIADTSELAGNLSIGTVVLESLVPFGGVVLDGSGRRLADTRITCTEVGFGGRSWSTTSNDDGDYDFLLPPVAMSCTLVPPVADVPLAWTVEQVDVSIDDGHQFEVRSGTQISGTVRLQGGAEQFSVIEVRNGFDELLGTALTDSAGSFSVQVDLPDIE